MATLTYEDREHSIRSDESVLETLQRRGIEIPSSCRTGVCSICLLRRIDGSPPAHAQVGLSLNLRERDYFLACRLRPEDDLEVAPPNDADLFCRVRVRAMQQLSPSTSRILLEPETPLEYQAGQFVNVRRFDGVIRSYSLSSVPDLDDALEIEVKRVPGGLMSTWLIDELQVGDELEIQGPTGRGYYAPGRPDQPLLMVGTGSGLAPLLGVARAALHRGHQGLIRLFHGARSIDEHHHRKELLELERRFENFQYTPCVSGDLPKKGFAPGRAEQVAFAELSDLEGWKVYLCGVPEMVQNSRVLAIGAGVDPLEIRADPHISGPQSQDAIKPTEYPEPDHELWIALEEGRLLTAILTDFYDKVYRDARLARFFEGVAQARAIEKQYNFLFKVFTGQDVYMGENPRTSHHWMVISDDLFDYREKLMVESMQKCGLSSEMIRRWRATQERYRRDIVKSEPFPKIIDGVELPLDGFGEMELAAGGICDLCTQVIDQGEAVRYHLRLGTTYCRECMA